MAEETLTLAGKRWTLEPTGLQYVAYTLTSGRKVCQGIRQPQTPDIMVVLDTNMRHISAFRESTRRALTRLA